MGRGEGVGGRWGLLGWAEARGTIEPVADGDFETGEDFGSVEGVVFGEDCDVVGAGIDAYGSPFRVDIPDETDAGVEVVLPFAVHL